MKYTIAVDMDEILCQLTPTWLDRYNTGTRDNVQPEDIKSWDIFKYCKHGKLVLEYLNEYGLFLNLKPVEGAIEGITRLVEAGHKIVIATAPPTIRSLGEKAWWIEEHLGHLGIGLDNMMMGKDKALLRADILIDDAPHNLMDFKGLTCTLDYPWNRHVEPNFRATHWSQIVDFILEE